MIPERCTLFLIIASVLIGIAVVGAGLCFLP